MKSKVNTQSDSKGKFSIIIPTWNNLEYLKLCVSGLRQNSKYDNQIIIAVNEGLDGTVEWLESQEGIDYMHSDTNLGVCYAVNSCRPLVAHDYIVYMNDDMYPAPDWDKKLFENILAINDDMFFLSATLVEPVKNSNPNYVAVIQNFGRDAETFDSIAFNDNYSELFKDKWRGSSWPPNVVHKRVWDLVGGFSTEFSPGMYSDPDFSMKLWNAGVRVMYGVGDSLVYHFGEKSTKRVKKNKGNITFLRKWGITARTYYSQWLKIGLPYTGPYSDKVILSRFTILRNKLKLIIKSF